MRILLAVAVLAVAACQPAPPLTTLAGVDLAKPTRALGTEPFWGVEIRPDEIVFTGVGKSAAELERAVALDFHAINVESPGELDRLDRIARPESREQRDQRKRLNPRLAQRIDAERAKPL